MFPSYTTLSVAGCWKIKGGGRPRWGPPRRYFFFTSPPVVAVRSKLMGWRRAGPWRSAGRLQPSRRGFDGERRLSTSGRLGDRTPTFEISHRPRLLVPRHLPEHPLIPRADDECLLQT